MTPSEIVNHTLLEVEYAVPIISFALCVQRGKIPGPPVATGDVSRKAIRPPFSEISYMMATAALKLQMGMQRIFEMPASWEALKVDDEGLLACLAMT